MATRGEIYLLDMGEPIKILDLAKTMARLHGRHAYLEGENNEEANGIRISVSGLRPGEKLYEELLVDGSEVPTGHPRVMCETSELSPSEVVEGWIKDIRDCSDGTKVVELMCNLPLSYSQAAA